MSECSNCSHVLVSSVDAFAITWIFSLPCHDSMTLRYMLWLMSLCAINTTTHLTHDHVCSDSVQAMNTTTHKRPLNHNVGMLGSNTHSIAIHFAILRTITGMSSLMSLCVSFDCSIAICAHVAMCLLMLCCAAKATSFRYAISLCVF